MEEGGGIYKQKFYLDILSHIVMVLVSDECARLLNCRVKDLRDRLNHPYDFNHIQNSLLGRKVKTTYKNRNGEFKTFTIGGITRDGANIVMAYGKRRQPFNTCIAAHFYARHRIELHYPYNQCVIESYHRGENRYYPLELLELVEERETEVEGIEDWAAAPKISLMSPLNEEKDEEEYTLTTEAQECAWTGGECMRAQCSQPQQYCPFW